MKKEELAKKIGKRIVLVRQRKGLSQAALARLCKKEPQSIERVESGNTNPTVFTLHEIASAMGVSIEELVKI